MCYLCKALIRGYFHFVLDIPGRRQLSSDTRRLHQVEVASAATEAREDLAIQQLGLRLRHDPIVDVAIPPGNLDQVV